MSLKSLNSLAAGTCITIATTLGFSSFLSAIAAPDIRVYSEVPDLETRLNTTSNNLNRLPQSHLDVVDPIFIVDRLPGGRRTGGGYYSPAEVRSAWLGKEHRTGVSDEDIHDYVLSQPDTGLIAITKAAFENRIYQFTVFHEIAHSVDHHLGIVPAGSSVSDFAGVRYQHPRVGEYAAETYARFMLVPNRICRDGSIPANETQSICSQRLTNVLMNSPAFWNVPISFRNQG
ncbi:MAG: hypothetical protein AAFV90_25215 [Cyanobacteria bacterium J06634_5]